MAPQLTGIKLKESLQMAVVDRENADRLQLGLVRTPRIAHLTSVHAANDVRIYQKECCSLFNAGYDVVLVATGESHADPRTPRVVGLERSRGRTDRMTRTLISVLREAVRTDAQLYHLHDPELIPIGVVLKLLRKQVIYDCHEYVLLDLQEKAYLPPPLRFVATKIAAVALKVADRLFDGIVVAAPGMLRDFANSSTTVINNYPEWDVTERPMRTFAERCPVVAYVGGISANRGIKEIITAVELAAKRTDIQLLLAGEFESPKLAVEVEQMPGWRYVNYRGHLPRTEVKRVLSDVLCGLVMFHDIPNHREASPNKLFEYMSLGLPTIVSDFASWRDLLGPIDGSLFVNPLDSQALSDCMVWIVENRDAAERMGMRGQNAVQERFNWSREQAKLLGLYKTVLRG